MNLENLRFLAPLEMTGGSAGPVSMTGMGTCLVESMHGAGSPQSQRVMYQRLGNLPQKIKMAKALAKIEK